MSCPGEKLSAWLDGELEPDEANTVAAHVAGCAACAEEARALEAVGEVLSEAAVPDPGAVAWAGFERELAEGLAQRRVPGWLLAAAGLLLAGLPLLALGTSERSVAAASRVASTPMEVPAPVWAPGGGSPAVPLESIAPVGLLRRARLDQAAEERLARDALVQVPSPATRLSELVCGPDDPLLPLATADASLLVSGAVLARAALVVELEHVRPRLLLLLRLLRAELLRATGEATTQELREELSRLSERLAVAVALLGEAPTGLPAEAQERVALEVGRVRAGRGALPGVIDPQAPEPVDYRRLRPRGAWADPEVADLARAEAWLARFAPRLDPAHAPELREAALLSALLARAKVAGGRSGLHLQAELEAAFELLSGPPDALTPLDVAAALGDLLGTRSPGPDALADATTLARLGALLRERARARGLPGVRGVGEGDATARFQLLGGRRTLEGWALDHLGALRGRPRPSALDLPALLGSRRARAALAALELDPVGLDAALAALRPAAQAFVSPGPFLPARASLEQARTWSAASLLGRPDRPPIPFQRSAAYVDRLLMAGLGGLVGPLAAPDATPGPAAPGPLPVVEPLPHLHARLAFGARRVSVALRELLPGESRRRDRALAQLERVALVEEALKDASLDLLEGRPLRPGCRRALGLWSAMVRDLGPPDARQSDLLYELLDRQGKTVAIQRAVLRLDRLVAVALDAEGRPVLAEGPALFATELLTPDEPVLDPAVLSALAESATPSWATHLVNR